MKRLREWVDEGRLAGLRRFALALTGFNIVGHLFLGFEQSWLQVAAGVSTAWFVEWLYEWVDSRATLRSPRYAGGLGKFVDFFLSAHITGLACSMLLYTSDRFWVIPFAAAAGIATKHVFRLPINGRVRHFLNPSNTGIAITLVLFPTYAIAPPYHFTEEISGVADWLLPAFLMIPGTLLNARYTGRLPLILAWVTAFVAQAVLRSLVFDLALMPLLTPMTGLAFILYSLYMVSDPATTPTSTAGQVAFGIGVAAAYALLALFHIVFGLFFALALVCMVRGIGHAVYEAIQRASPRQPTSSPQLTTK